MMGGFGGMGGWGFGMGLAMMVMPVAVLGLIAWAVVSAARLRRDDVELRESRDRSGSRSLRKRSEPDALSLAILQERYAEGDLDTETYRRMREELER